MMRSLGLFVCAAFLAPSVFAQIPVHPRLAEQSEQFSRQIVEVTDGVHVAIGYGLANSILIQGDGGVVIVDATESDSVAREIKAVFDAISMDPVRAIVYTHSHRDHTLGADVFAGDDDPAIYAHVSFNENELAANPSRLAIRLRSRRQFGLGLSPGDRPNAGIGPALRVDLSGQDRLLPPTHTIENELAVSIAGIRMKLVHAPGETADQIYVYLPDHEVLLPGDNFYHSFPNLYAIRGTRYRDVRDWASSLDRMLAENAEYLIPSHTLPVVGREEIRKRLADYRDAIISVHDQTVAGINQGLTPDQIVERVKLPDRLAGAYLDEVYGTVEWSVRAIFDGYLGWFSGNPTDLFPLSPLSRAERMAELSGGRRALFERAQTSCASDDLQWCLELLDHVIVLGYEAVSARRLKATALERLAEMQTSANARNYYLTAAAELRAGGR